VGEPVEAEAASRPLRREGVGRGGGRQGGVERGVEAGGRLDAAEPARHGVDGGERPRLVQRREGDQLLQPAAKVVVDPGRRPEVLAAVHHAMPDRVWRREPVESLCGERRAAGPVDRPLGDRPIVCVEYPELQAARARIDDEQPHRVSPATSNRGRRPDPRRARACRRGGGAARRPYAGVAPRRAARAPARGR
jgi:hypothetical protein